MKEKIIIVDENDNIIGTKNRESIELGDIYRVSALWISNSKNQILIAKRSINKKNDPGKWGPAVSGTVERKEGYWENIIKETEEEIGIDLEKYNFKEIDKIRVKGKYNFFCQWYFLEEDLEIDKLVLQGDEVDKIMWINKKDFENRLKTNPEEYTISMPQHFAFLKKY